MRLRTTSGEEANIGSSELNVLTLKLSLLSKLDECNGLAIVPMNSPKMYFIGEEVRDRRVRGRIGQRLNVSFDEGTRTSRLEQQNWRRMVSE